MTAREMATIWIIGIAAVIVIIFDHRNQAASILNVIGVAPAQDKNQPLTIVTGPSTNIGTNNPMPIVGNEFGALAVYGDSLAGDTQPQGSDNAFGDLFNNLMGQS